MEKAVTARLAIFILLLASVRAHATSVRVEAPDASPGETVAIDVLLEDAGDSVASLALDVGFPPGRPIGARPNGRPDCRVRDEIHKASSAFSYRPSGCTLGADCDTLRVGITSFDPDTAKLPIPDGIVFTCKLTVPSTAPVGERILIEALKASAISPDDRETDITPASSGAFVDVVARPVCAGDCDGDGRVGIGELTRAVAIGLGLLKARECSGLDADGREGVTVDELIGAEVNAGIGCPSASLPR